MTLGELWAWPSMLKLALIENLRRLSEEVLEAREARRRSDEYLAALDRGADRSVDARDAPPLTELTSLVHLLHRVRE